MLVELDHKNRNVRNLCFLVNEKKKKVVHILSYKARMTYSQAIRSIYHAQHILNKTFPLTPELK
jgi:hypothetical protein